MSSAPAEKLKEKLELPVFETKASEVQSTITQLIENSKKRIDAVAHQSREQMTFESTLGALDDIDFEEESVTSRIYTLMNTSPHPELRQACEKAIVEFEAWAIEKSFNKDLYETLEAYEKQATNSSNLSEEQQKLLKDTLNAFRRKGLHLSEEKQARLKSLFQEVSEKETAFHSNINNYNDEYWVKKEDLEGLDPSVLSSLETNAHGLYKLTLDYPIFLPVLEQVHSEEVRKTLLEKKQNTAADKNVDLLNELLQLRKEIAETLGYASWNHYVISDRMAGSPERVDTFLQDLAEKLKEKGQEELAGLKALKAKKTGTKDPEFHLWDYRYYSHLWKQEQFQVDSQEVKKYFPFPQTLNGMFEIYSRIFQIQFQEEPEGTYYRWHPDVRLFRCLDSSGTNLGLFYLDLHSRPGKYGHACVIGMVPAKRHTDGVYQRPVATMLCNFPKGQKNEPALLPHDQVETLFHEFGHILHQLLTQANYSAFAGTSVKRDFVEAPSQVLENWIWDADVLQTFAKHYEDPQKVIPKDLVARMLEAQKAGSALFYLRQVSLARADIELHGEGDQKDADEICQRVFAELFLPQPPGTHFAAGWGHMVGYASGYYGYAWADVMAKDMFSLFEERDPFDRELGDRLRREIFEPGGSRDENKSLEAFLGRALSNKAFLEDLGA